MPEVQDRYDDPALLLTRGRRLADKLIIAFHAACDQGELEVAAALLRVVDAVLRRPVESPDKDRRKKQFILVAAYERLWLMRHSGPKVNDAPTRGAAADATRSQTLVTLRAGFGP